MKILQVVQHVKPIGGVTDVCYHLSKELAKQNHEVTIITTDAGLSKEFVVAVERNNIRIIPFHCIAELSGYLFSPSIKKWLHSSLESFDVIHMHNFRTYQNSATHTYAKKFGVPYLLQAHGSVLPFFGRRLIKRSYDILEGNAIIKDAAKLIALTAQEEKQYKTMGVEPQKTTIVPNGIDASEFADLPAKGTFRARYAIAADERVVLFLGRLNRIKGVDRLIKAFARLVERLDKAILVIVGPDDGALAQLEGLVNAFKLGDSVIFTGPLYDHRKLEAYVDAEVYVLPSVYETFPLTVLEAWACGTPVIATTACGIADLVKRFGYVVQLNVEEMCDAMFRIFNDEETSKRFGDEGKRLVMEELNWDQLVHRIEYIYDEARVAFES